VRGIKIKPPKVKFGDGTAIELNPGDTLCFMRKQDRRILGWNAKPVYIPKREVTVGVFADNNVNRKRLLKFLQRIKTGHITPKWEFPGIEKMFKVTLTLPEKPNDIDTLDTLWQTRFSDYDVILIVSSNEKIEEKEVIRIRLFERGIPNKFLVFSGDAVSKIHIIYSVGRGIIARAGHFIPYILHDYATVMLKDLMGDDTKLIFIDSTIIPGFISGSVYLGTAAIVCDPSGIANDVLIIPHKSEWDKLSATVRKLDEENLINTNAIFCVHGHVSVNDLEFFKAKMKNYGQWVLIEITRESLDPLIVREINGNTPWGYGLEAANGRKYIINLTWYPEKIRGIVRPLMVRFRVDPFNDLRLRREIIKNLSWSPVLSPEAPVRFPSTPYNLYLADRLCKLLYRLFEALIKPGEEIKVLNRIIDSLGTLVKTRGGFPLLIHG